MPKKNGIGKRAPKPVPASTSNGNQGSMVTERPVQLPPQPSSGARMPINPSAKIAPPSNHAEPAPSISSNSQESLSTGVQRPAAPPRPSGPPAVPSRIVFKVIYAFNAQEQTELSVSNGEEVDVVRREDNGWWMVRNGQGAEGWVPANYLEQVKAPTGPPQRAPPPSRPVTSLGSANNLGEIPKKVEVVPLAVPAATVAPPDVQSEQPAMPEWKRQLMSRLEQQQEQPNKPTQNGAAGPRPNLNGPVPPKPNTSGPPPVGPKPAMLTKKFGNGPPPVVPRPPVPRR
jgi:myosin-1